jgi:hypothetical protein
VQQSVVRRHWLAKRSGVGELLPGGRKLSHLPVSRFLLPVHALQRRAEVPRPCQRRAAPEGDAQAFGVSDSQYQAAQSTCQHLLPTGGSFDEQAYECIQAGDCPPALVQQMLTVDRKFAQCMRSHGVPNWPDPSFSDVRAPIFKVSAVGITHSQTHSAPMSNTIMECLRLDPAPVAMA